MVLKRWSLLAALSMCLVAAAAFGRFLGECVVDVFRSDLPLDAGTSLHTDQVQRTARMEVADAASPAGAMFSERARDHQLYIGDGFTHGGLALPI